ncbi:O-antigen polymerase [Silvanigrella aquatica]|uniref:O-antigen polymerase n=1 Tax=Silvanigrella aquatica TaxID=1915309 RepID=UPI000AEDD0EB|nr:O-antigen polymerase [Silvanigrella aquatica]
MFDAIDKKNIFFEYNNKLLKFSTNISNYKQEKLSINWILFYIFISIIMNPFFSTFKDIKINIILDFFGLIMPFFFIKKINILGLYYFIAFFALVSVQLIFLVYATKNINVMFQSRMTMYFICQIYLFYCILSQIPYKYILSAIKVVNYFVLFIIFLMIIEFFTADIFISKLFIKEYIPDYRFDLYTYFSRLYNGTSPNLIILGAQHSNIVSLIACFIFFPLFKNDLKNKIKLFVFFPICFVIFILTMTMTSLICLIVFLVFISFSAKGTIFFNKYFKIFSLFCLAILSFSWEFLIYIKSGKVYNSSYIQYYIDVFTNPIRRIFSQSNNLNVLLGSGSYPEVWYKSNETVEINADFGYGMWVLSDGIIVVFVLTAMFFYSLYVYAKSPLFSIGKRGAYNYLGILITPFTYCFFVFTSIIHYQTLFQIGIKQLFCFYFSVILYFIFYKKNVKNKSELIIKKIITDIKLGDK